MTEGSCMGSFDQGLRLEWDSCSGLRLCWLECSDEAA